MTPFSTKQSKNLKPLVKVYDVPAFGKTTYQQGSMNLSPVVKPATSLSPLDILKNKVTNADSSKLQAASKLPGRVSDGGPINFE